MITPQIIALITGAAVALYVTIKSNSMSIKIERQDYDVVYVNEKRVQLDADNRWIAPYDELTPAETKAFHAHLNAEKMNLQNRLN